MTLRAALLGIALAVAASAGCAARSPVTRRAEPRPVDFTAGRSGGAVYRLSQDRGRVVVIDVWATWCEPCKQTLPIIDALHREYAPKGVRVYALNVDADSQDLPEFLKKLDVHLPVLLDPNADAADCVLGVRRMPTSFVIDQEGIVRARHEGLAPDYLKRVRGEVEELLAEGAGSGDEGG